MKKTIAALALFVFGLAAHAQTKSPISLLNPTGSTAGQAIVSTGSSSAPAWGSVAATALAAMPANTIVANATGSSAAPTAYALPSCSASGDALINTSGTGIGCGTNFASALGITSGTNPSSGYVGQVISSSIPIGSAVSLTSGSPANVTSISLPAGEWLIYGNCYFNPASTTTSNDNSCWTSTASATFPTQPNGGAETINSGAITVNNGAFALSAGTQIINQSSSSTLYLSVYSSFATSTMSAFGFVAAVRIH